MDVVVLGSGQDGGTPQLGFGRPAGPHRTASSLAVLAGETVMLFDVSPDVRIQQRRLLEERGYTTTSGEVFDAVFLTHGHMGHYAGLVHFGRESLAATGIPVFGTESMLRYLQANEPWASLFTAGHVEAAVAEAGVAMRFGGLELTPIAVPHRAEHTDTVAWSIDGRVLYLPDIDTWDAWPQARGVVDRHALAFLDGTFYDEREPPGRSYAEVPHPRVVDTVDRFAGSPSRIVLTHLNWSNPAANPRSPEAARCRDSGFSIAEDQGVFSA